VISQRGCGGLGPSPHSGGKKGGQQKLVFKKEKNKRNKKPEKKTDHGGLATPKKVFWGLLFAVGRKKNPKKKPKKRPRTPRFFGVVSWGGQGGGWGLGGFLGTKKWGEELKKKRKTVGGKRRVTMGGGGICFGEKGNGGPPPPHKKKKNQNRVNENRFGKKGGPPQNPWVNPGVGVGGKKKKPPHPGGGGGGFVFLLFFFSIWDPAFFRENCGGWGGKKPKKKPGLGGVFRGGGVLGFGFFCPQHEVFR